MKNLKLKKNLFMLASSFVIYSTYVSLTKYEPNFEIIEDEGTDAYGKYSGGLIYIGDWNFLKSLKDNVKEGDVLVLDRRYVLDPDMQVLESYKITNQNDIKDIINCLLCYEEAHPTRWDRTLNSMTVEWEAHNFLYNLNYKRSSTDDVDLNNTDEEIYNSIFIKKLFLRW